MIGPVEKLRAALEAADCDPKGDAKGKAKCPAHPDRMASLTWGPGRDGNAVVKCHAGCPAPSIVEKLGMKLSDLFADSVRTKAPPRRRVEVSRAAYELKNAAGNVVAVHHRVDFDPKSKDMWFSRNGRNGLDGFPGNELPLYGTELLADRPTDRVLITEGEKKADAARKRGVLALGTATGASSEPGPIPLEVLRGRDVLLWPDNDVAGFEHMRRVAAGLEGVAASVRIVRWTEAPPKGDAADFTGTDEAFHALLDAAFLPSEAPSPADASTSDDGPPEPIPPLEAVDGYEPAHDEAAPIPKPPADERASDAVERQIIAGLFHDPAVVFPLVREALEYLDFRVSAYRVAMRAAVELHLDGVTLSHAAIVHHAKQSAFWTEEVGALLDAVLSDPVVTPPNGWADLARIVRKAHDRRRAEDAAHAASDRLRAAPDDPGALADAIERMREAVAGHEESADVDGGGFRWASTEDFLAEPEEPHDFLWHPIIARGSATLFVAAAKCGKTWLLFALLGAMSRHDEWLGRATPTNDVPVLLVSEEPRWIIRKRFRKFGIVGNVEVLTRDRMPRVRTWAGIVAAAEAKAKRIGAGLVIFDTISTLAGILDENASADVNAALAPTTELGQRTGAAVVVVHHEGKNGLVRGSTAFDGAVECIVQVKRVGGDGSRKRNLHAKGRFEEITETPITVEYVTGKNGGPDGYKLSEGAAAKHDAAANAEIVRIDSVQSRIVRVLDNAKAEAVKRKRPELAWPTRKGLKECGIPDADLHEFLWSMADAGKIQRERIAGQPGIPKARGGGFIYADVGVASLFDEPPPPPKPAKPMKPRKAPKRGKGKVPVEAAAEAPATSGATS